VPRTLSLVALAALTVAAALLNAFATLPLLGAAAFLSGFTFGGLQARRPAPAHGAPARRAGWGRPVSRVWRAACELTGLAPPACTRKWQERSRACRRAARQHLSGGSAPQRWPWPRTLQYLELAAPCGRRG